jgi:hypothetical protein
MDPLYKPLGKEEKEQLKKRGLKEFEYMAPNKWIDPDSTLCNKFCNIIDHACSGIILSISILGRHWARKNCQPCGLYSMNILLIPIFYFASFKIKHVDQTLNPYRPRPTFNEALEFYPVTRRAFKRAMILREQEMDLIKARVGNVEAINQ